MEDFDKLYRTYYRQVYLYLLDLCKEPDLAEEPYKEVFWMRTFGELSFKEIGEDCNMEYGKPRTGQFVVFPAEISPQMYVRDFRYVYYNPWDPQYVTYLTVEYKDAEAYGKELKRLQTIGVEEYLLPGFDATLDNPYEQKMMGK